MDRASATPSPLPLITSYPSAVAIVAIVTATIILLWVAAKIDQSGGQLVVSLLVVVTFVGVVAYCLVFAIPTDEINSTVIGGLATAFGAVVMFWLGRPRGVAPPPKKDEPPPGAKP